jgi:hypothetical protein
MGAGNSPHYHNQQNTKMSTTAPARRNIQFDTTIKPSSLEAPAPPKEKTESSGSGFRNLIFKGEAWKLGMKFTKPVTWLRFLPPIAGSKYNWLLRLEVFKDKGGVSFVSPRTFDPKAKDPFYLASKWLKEHKPELLSNRDTNPGGFKLWASPVGVAWCIEREAEEGSRLRIFNSSLYDGVRGGTPGLGANIQRLADTVDTEPGSETLGQKIYGDITAPDSGRLVKVDKSKTEKAEYASYTPSIGKNPAPLSDCLGVLTDDEHNSLEPIENLIYVPTEIEIHEILKGYIGEALYKEIFPA